MRVRKTESDIDGSSTPQQRYDFTPPGAHVVSGLYAVSATVEGRFYYQQILLQIKDVTPLAKIHRLNGVQYRSSRKACQARGFLAHDAEWGQTIVNAFRSNFEPLTIMFDSSLGQQRAEQSARPFELSSWNAHHIHLQLFRKTSVFKFK